MRSKILMLVTALLLAVPVMAQTPHNADQVGLSIFSAPDNAIRVNMAPVPAASTPNPHDLNQTFLSIFDQGNNAIQAVCVSGCGTWTGTGAVLLAPTTDQDIIGAYTLSASKFWGKSAVGVGGSAVPGSDANGNSTLLDIEGTSTFSTSLKQLRPLNIAVTWNPSANAYIGQGINIDFETDASNSKDVASIVGLSVLSAHNGSGTTSYLEGAVYDTYLQGSGLATGGILAATYSVENDATSAGAIPWTHALDVQSGVGGASTTTLDATAYFYSPITHSGVMTHHYGIYLEDQTTGGGTKNPDAWSIYSLGGPAHFAGALDAGRLKTTVIHTAALVTCDAGAETSLQGVDDSDTQTWGATVVHTSGALHALAYCDGTNWTVIGK